MAGGKESPRQKMINLMYLVLMAMLALNVSSEVMEAFSKMFYRSESAIETSVEKNKTTLAELKQLSIDKPSQYQKVYGTGIKVNELTEEVIKEISALKTKITESAKKNEEGKLVATTMDKSEVLDTYLFKGDGNSPAGDKFVNTINKYREGMMALVASNPNIVSQLKTSFSTDATKVDGVKKPWLSYNFEGLPSIGSAAVLSSMENAVLNIENETLNGFISGRLKKAASASQLQAMVIPDKTAFFQGEKFTGKVFLASKDASKVPTKVTINGRNLNLNDSKVFSGGIVNLALPAGRVGENKIVGEFTFMENGKAIKIPVSSNFAVVTKPNGAVISADKMNVVYRGLDNPITISMPGVSANKINATASGLRKVSGSSYNLKPGSGKTVTINVSGTTDSGEKITSPAKQFRIKDIPAAMASIRGQYGSLKMPKASLAKSSVQAGLPDFVFDLKLKVKSFKVKVPGKTTVLVTGSRMNGQAQKAISGAKRGDVVTIFGMKADIVGNSSYKMKTVLPIAVEISN